MAVVDIARKNTAGAKEKFLLRYKNKAYRKILNKIFIAARQGSETIQIRLDELFFRHLNDDIIELLKKTLVDAFYQDGFHVETYYLSDVITISWENKNEQ